MGNNLIFNEELHQYSIDGAIIPSVTQILKDVGIIDFTNIPASILKKACNFGTAAHKATELYDKGILDEEALDVNLRPYLNGWIKFLKDTAFVIETIEEHLYSAIYRFAGTTDRVGRIDGVLTIPDIKTGFEISSANAIQLAGYELIVKENLMKKEKIRRMSVLLTPKGDYKIQEYKDKNDTNIFISALAIYNWKGKNGKRN